MIEGKVWGETRQIFGSESVSIHHLKIKRGGFSSKHRHQFKGNLFYVLLGRVVVREWTSDGPKASVDETILGVGQVAGVGPLAWHQFEALEDAEIIEVYFANLQSPDIIRRSQGGVKCEAEIRAGRKRSE